jgi:predicted DNA-binding protein
MAKRETVVVGLRLGNAERTRTDRLAKHHGRTRASYLALLVKNGNDQAEQAMRSAKVGQ